VNAVIYLLTTVITKNETGQVLARQHYCLHSICEHFSAQWQTLDDAERDLIDDVVGVSLLQQQTCYNLITALSACVSNPRNELDQQLCADRLMTEIFLVIDGCVGCELLKHTTFLLNALLDDCLSNKKMALKANGLEVLLSCLIGLGSQS